MGRLRDAYRKQHPPPARRDGEFRTGLSVLGELGISMQGNPADRTAAETVPDLNGLRKEMHRFAPDIPKEFRSLFDELEKEELPKERGEVLLAVAAIRELISSMERAGGSGDPRLVAERERIVSEAMELAKPFSTGNEHLFMPLVEFSDSGPRRITRELDKLASMMGGMALRELKRRKAAVEMEKRRKEAGRRQLFNERQDRVCYGIEQGRELWMNITVREPAGWETLYKDEKVPVGITLVRRTTIADAFTVAAITGAVGTAIGAAYYALTHL